MLALGNYRTAKLLFFGIGGVGSFAVEALARSGVGSFILVDHDTICVTNINRQIHAMTYRWQAESRSHERTNPGY